MSEGPAAMSSAEELRRRWTDAVVHAPLGALVLRGKDPQRWTQAGRNQLVTARFLGKLIIDGRRRAAVSSATRRSTDQRAGAASARSAASEVQKFAPLAAPVSPGGTMRATAPIVARSTAPVIEHVPASPKPATRPSDSSAAESIESAPDGRPTELGIDAYDLLPASDVLALLDRLTPAERAAVRAHEAAGRGRRTILHRLDELDAAASRAVGTRRRASAPGP